MTVEKEKQTSPDKVFSPNKPSFTLVLNGSPKNILKDALSPTARSYLDILQSFPPTHIINTHANQLTVTALSVMYIGTRLLENGGYALSIVQNSTHESIQERIMNNRRTQHEPQQCRCVATCSEQHSWSWQEFFEPKSFVLLTPMTFLSLFLIPEWMEKYGTPKMVYIDNLNRYPPWIRSFLYPLIRVILRYDPTVQMIITTPTISKVNKLANLFLDAESEYVHIK